MLIFRTLAIQQVFVFDTGCQVINKKGNALVWITIACAASFDLRNVAKARLQIINEYLAVALRSGRFTGAIK